MTSVWTDPYGPPEATCRGCGRGLWPRGENWADSGGIEVCIKAPLETIGQGRRPGYVLHEPMPDGLRGAVQPVEP